MPKREQERERDREKYRVRGVGRRVWRSLLALILLVVIGVSKTSHWAVGVIASGRQAGAGGP